MSLPPPATVLTVEEAAIARTAHEERADALTAGHRARRAAGQKHPVEDFLFTYYPFSASQLRRWHPGWEVAYEAAADPVPGLEEGPIGDIRPGGGRGWYVDGEAGGKILRRADIHRYVTERTDALGFITSLLRSSSLSRRSPNFGCFGLHEWAMVYRLSPGQTRHENLPLRLGQAATDAVVEQEKLVCSHVDAFRFFTPEAVPRNASAPRRDTQIQRDNPACLHVGMDLYKWAMKLAPLVPSDLILDCFEHARDTRVLDMEASPYDVQPLGYGVVPIETPKGKAKYQRRQRHLAGRADELRERILEHVAVLAGAAAH